jgi:hypothetical protein
MRGRRGKVDTPDECRRGEEEAVRAVNKWKGVDEE